VSAEASESRPAAEQQWRRPEYNRPDYAQLAGLFSSAVGQIMHHDHPEWTHLQVQAEAMRRAVEDYRSGLVTKADATKAADDAARTWRFNAGQFLQRAETAEQKLHDLGRRSERDVRHRAAEVLRSVATHTMTKYRREGWEHAIEHLWPSRVPAEQAAEDAAVLEAHAAEVKSTPWPILAARACGERDALEELLIEADLGDEATETLAKLRSTYEVRS
jgi:hypothetical protein